MMCYIIFQFFRHYKNVFVGNLDTLEAYLESSQMTQIFCENSYWLNVTFFVEKMFDVRKDVVS